VAIVAAVLVHWIILRLRLPAFTWITGWFWPFQVKQLDPRWVLLALAPCLAIVPLLATKGRYWLKVALLVVFGYTMQLSFGFSEGRGIDGVADRMRNTGHARFANAAVRQESVIKVMREYKYLALYNEITQYGKTKPPGQLLLYMFTQRIADRLFPRAEQEQQLDVLRKFASYTWPLMAYLVLFPLFWLTKIIFDHRTGILACALYTLVPSVNLITLHTDQAFFPLLFVSCPLLAAISTSRRTLFPALAAGAVAYLAVYCSFGLACVVPLAIAVSVIVSRTKAEPGKGAYWYRAMLGLILGFLVLDLINRAAFNYDIWARFRYSMAHHIGLKGYEYNLRNVMYFSFSNLLEQMVWTGLPIYLLAWVGMLASVWAALRRRLDAGSLLSLALLALIATLLLFGRTFSEVARLWLFLVPVFCVVAAWQMNIRASLSRYWVTALVVVLQWGTTYLTKHFQDFY
jgi:hypothetical protein